MWRTFAGSLTRPYYSTPYPKLVIVLQNSRRRIDHCIGQLPNSWYCIAFAFVVQIQFTQCWIILQRVSKKIRCMKALNVVSKRRESIQSPRYADIVVIQHSLTTLRWYCSTQHSVTTLCWYCSTQHSVTTLCWYCSHSAFTYHAMLIL